MIRINLLPREKRGKRGQANVPWAAILTLVILAVGGMWGYWLFVRWEVT